MFCIVENERFTFEIDSENAIQDCALEPNRAKSLLKMLRIVENERFTVEIDSENSILDVHWNAEVISF